MATEKKYTRGFFVNEKQTQFGSLMNIDILAKDFIEFIKENTNEKGYCKITVMKAKEGGKNTHYAVLNDWKPTGEKPKTLIDDLAENEDTLPF